MNFEKPKSPKEIAEINKERELSASGLIKGGAEYIKKSRLGGSGWGYLDENGDMERQEVFSARDKARLEVTKEQIEKAKKEMGEEMDGENKIESEMPVMIDKNSAVKSFEKGTPIDYVVTKMGSVYKYLPDGRTQRFKKVENKKQDPQDAIVFVPDWEWVKKNMPKEYQAKNIFGENNAQYGETLLEYIQTRGRDKSKKSYIIDEKGKKLYTNEEIAKEKRIFLWFGEKDKDERYTEHFRVPVSSIPTIGYSTFDMRSYKEGNEWMKERHLGNEVIEIARKV